MQLQNTYLATTGQGNQEHDTMLENDKADKQDTTRQAQIGPNNYNIRFWMSIGIWDNT